MARFCRALSVALLFFSTPFAFHLLTGGFRAQKVLFERAWGVTTPVELDLSGPFFYIGRGLQCYAFTDQSGEFVIKLFRSDLRRYRSPQLLEKKIDRTFTSYMLAYDHLREETGLLALHLNTTQGALPCATFYDRIAIPHTLPLDRLHFVVQKRAIPFAQALKQASREELPQLLNSLHQVIEKRLAYGIHKTDASLPGNVGFISTQAVEFDCGDYVDLHADPSEVWKEQERLSVQAALNNWLARHIPEHIYPFQLKVTQED